MTMDIKNPILLQFIMTLDKWFVLLLGSFQKELRLIRKVRSQVLSQLSTLLSSDLFLTLMVLFMILGSVFFLGVSTKLLILLLISYSILVLLITYRLVFLEKELE